MLTSNGTSDFREMYDFRADENNLVHGRVAFPLPKSLTIFRVLAKKSWQYYPLNVGRVEPWLIEVWPCGRQKIDINCNQ
jgi:hypothetical protein